MNNSQQNATAVAQLAADLLNLPLSERDAAAVADLLNALGQDMAAMRRLSVGSEEPAVIYQARQP